MTDEKCGDCVHWHKLQKQHVPGQAAAIGQKDERGACRLNPPSATTLLTNQGGTLVLCNYPMLPPEFPACAQFHQREECMDET